MGWASHFLLQVANPFSAKTLDQSVGADAIPQPSVALTVAAVVGRNGLPPGGCSVPTLYSVTETAVRHTAVGRPMPPLRPELNVSTKKETSTF